MSKVLFLSRSDVVKCLDPRLLVESLAGAFKEHSQSEKTSLGLNFRLGPGTLTSSSLGETSGIPALSHKVESRFPGRTIPTSGLIELFDQESGELFCLLESSHISAVSSALAAALATDLLANPQARRLAVVGTGTQGWLGVRFLLEMRNLEEVTLFDLQRKRSRAFAERLKKYPELRVTVCDALTDTVAQSDMLLCATWSRAPFLYQEMIMPGVHITSLGSDQVGKRELELDLLKSSSVFCDDRELAVTSGALWEVSGGEALVAGELGEVLAGTAQGRASEEEITIYVPVGLPFQDLIAGWAAYERAMEKGLGQVLEL